MNPNSYLIFNWEKIVTVCTHQSDMLREINNSNWATFVQICSFHYRPRYIECFCIWWSTRQTLQSLIYTSTLTQTSWSERNKSFKSEQKFRTTFDDEHWIDCFRLHSTPMTSFVPTADWRQSGLNWLGTGRYLSEFPLEDVFVVVGCCKQHSVSEHSSDWSPPVDRDFQAPIWTSTLPLFRPWSLKEWFY